MFSAGFVVQPTKNFSASVDWWEVLRSGTIQTFDATELLRNYDLFQDRFFRRPDGTIAGIDTRWVNAGKTSTKGIEFGAKGEADVAGGKVTASFDLSYLLGKKTKFLPNSPWGANEVNRFTRSSDIGLEWKHTASIGYRRGNWSVLVNNLYRNAYTDAVLPGVAAGRVRPPDWQPRVAPYNTYGVSFTYRGIKNITVIAGVKNIFDEDPPFSATYDTNTGAGSSWEPRIADPRGRSYTLRVDYKFY
jgi:iron complex outermembrane receptor protein